MKEEGEARVHPPTELKISSSPGAGRDHPASLVRNKADCINLQARCDH